MTKSKNVRPKKEKSPLLIGSDESYECGRRVGLLEAADIAEVEDLSDTTPFATLKELAIMRGLVRATALSIAKKIRKHSKLPPERSKSG